MRLDGTEYRYSNVILPYPKETLFTKRFFLTNSTKHVKKSSRKVDDFIVKRDAGGVAGLMCLTAF